MFLIILVNTNNKSRAFIKGSKAEAKRFSKEMQQGGWLLTSINEVDMVCFKTLKISIN